MRTAPTAITIIKKRMALIRTVNRGGLLKCPANLFSVTA